MEDMSELMSELVTVESAPHIHHNKRNLVHLDDITAAKLDAAMKCKEGEEITLKTKIVLNVYTDARHKGVESLALWPDCGLSFEHRLDVVTEAEGCVTKKFVDPTVTERNASKHVNPVRLSRHPPISHGSEKGPSKSNHSIREKCSEVLDPVRSFFASVELTLVKPRTTVAQSARSAES